MEMDNNEIENSGEESFAELFEQSFKQQSRLKPGDKIEATILKISGEWVFLDIGTKGEGVLERKELLDAEGNLTVAEGDRINAWFLSSSRNEMRFTTKVGSGQAAQAQIEDAWRGGIPVEGNVEKEVKGGFEVRIGGAIRAFCPYSQMSLRRIDNASEFVGKSLSFNVAEYAEKGRNIILSRRALLEEERKQKKEALKETLKEGMTVTGVVTSLQKFGAFVNAGGVEGLLPISEIGWTRVKQVSDVLEVGQEITVVVKKIDWDNEKFSFSLKDTLSDPWDLVAQKYPEGSYHMGTVARLAQFGAFVSLGEGIDGLIHISRLGAGKRIAHPREIVQEGQTIEVKVESVDRENRKLSLSLASVSKAAEEEEKAITDFRQAAANTSAESMGSLGELLKAKLDTNGKR